MIIYIEAREIILTLFIIYLQYFEDQIADLDDCPNIYIDHEYRGYLGSDAWPGI